MPRNLAERLILSLTMIVVVVAAVSGLINVRNQGDQLVESMIVGADQLSRGIASATWHVMLANHRESAYAVMQTIAEKQGIDRIRIYNRDGRVTFSTSAGEGNIQVTKQSETCKVCHAAAEPLERVEAKSRARIFREPDGHRSLSMVTPIYNETSCSQAACHAHEANTKVLGVLDVALSLKPVDQKVAQMELHVAAVTGIQIVLISVFIYFFTRRFVSVPIGQLIEGTKAVSAMELDKPIVVAESSEELDELARSFNGMRERLQQAVAEINRFTEQLETKVTERTEQLSIAHQRLMKSDRLASLGQLAASVAHEINNPISGVLNLSMLLQRILKDDGVPRGRIGEFRKYLEQIASETTRVGRIVSDLLVFARRSKPRHMPADLNRLVKTTLSLAEHKLKLNNVEVELDLQPGLPPVPCDSSQIQQVVLNLVLNGAEATQAKGHGRITVKTSSGNGAETVLLSVTDDGEGIAPENLSRIFDPFFTTKPEGKGVGLGLAVSYGIVEAHGGEVEVKSKVGEGTTFLVTLPLKQPETPQGVLNGAVVPGNGK